MVEKIKKIRDMGKREFISAFSWGVLTTINFADRPSIREFVKVAKKNGFKFERNIVSKTYWNNGIYLDSITQKGHVVPYHSNASKRIFYTKGSLWIKDTKKDDFASSWINLTNEVYREMELSTEYLAELLEQKTEESE